MIAIKHNISLERVFQFLLGPVPWSLATSDDTSAKTDKSGVMHCLESESHVSEKPAADTNIYIIDGNAISNSLVAFPSTFAELFDSLFVQLPKKNAPCGTSQIRTSRTQSKQSRKTGGGRLQRLRNQGPQRQESVLIQP
jgi:hypothetical protein